MQRKYRIVQECLLLLACAIIFCGCRESIASAFTTTTEPGAFESVQIDGVLPVGLNYQVVALADPSFFDQIPARFQDVFPRPSGAEFIHEGLREEISSEDSRLIRLMNLLEYSWRDDSTLYLQGLVSEEEAAQWFREPLPLLVIRFSEATETDEYDYDRVDQILVCGAEILIYYHDYVNGVMIEDHKPFAAYLWEMKESGLITKDNYDNAFDHARETPWLDLLTYCGFN